MLCWTVCSAIWILANAQAVSAFATSTKPSGSRDDILWQMEPTPPPTSQAKKFLAKRDGLVDSSQPTLCGWKNWNISQPLTCDESYYCNADSSGNFGCCPDSSADATVANSCGYVTTCYESICDEKCQSDAWAAVCTKSLSTHCIPLNLTISGSYYTNYECDTISARLYSEGVPVVAPRFIENTTSTLSLMHPSPPSEVTTTMAVPTELSTTSAAPKGGVAAVVIVVLCALVVLT